MANILEVIMLICFGFSWPINIRKLYLSGSTKGVSFFFYIMIDIGYACGILAKVVKYYQGVSTPVYVVAVYCINLILVTACMAVYLRNKKMENV